MVTTFNAGDMVNVTWQITVPHDGYFRISIAEKAAKNVTMADFPDPPFTNATQCSLDLAAVMKGPHDNVLMDGIDPTSTGQMVKLPNKPCDACTLQVIQVMKDHGPPNCIYYHCADIKVLAAGATGGAGSGAAGATGGAGAGAAGSSGMGAAGAAAGSGGSPAAGSGGMKGTGGAPVTGGASGGSSGGVGMGVPVQGAGPGMTTGTGGVGAPSGGFTGTGGMPMTTSTKKSGCAVAEPGRTGTPATFGLLALGLAALRARRRAKRRG
jgi:MYXO-CTERM domain-containing protein